MKVLNLYAGIGGNRKLWENVDVTAVEIDSSIAEIYQDFFPDDKVVVEDAHQYLLEHFKEFDFIWSSPPCQTHSVCNHFLNPQGVVRYPDMSLYQEIIFLQTFSKSTWVVENVKSYYLPLIKPQTCGRHYFWSNFSIIDKQIGLTIGRMNGELQHRLRSKRQIELAFDKPVKEQLLNNCVHPLLGKHVFDCAFKQIQQTLFGGVNADSSHP